MKTRFKTILILFLILINYSVVYGQDQRFSKNNIKIGFRINSPNKRTAINIMPINVYFGNNSFAEFHARIELDFKF